MKRKTNKSGSRQNIARWVPWAILTIMGFFILTACNDGGGGGLLAGGGIGGTGISIGEISGFGSVIVNDVEFDTGEAEVVVNGQSRGTGDAVVLKELALGMVVRVEGKFLDDGTGKADRIVFNENVKGPVTAIETLDTALKKIVVLGQIVILDDRTKFRDTDFKIGDFLQISGWANGGGNIQATYVAKVEETGDGDMVTVKGIVSEVNVPNLRINQLNVDFSQADLRGFPDDAPPAAGQLVVATGDLDGNGVLVAEEVTLEDDLDLDDADDVDIEGIVTQFSSPADFVLGTTAVETDGSTSFKGIEPDDVVPGARLLVKGALMKGRLLADEVTARDKVSIEGQIENVDDGSEEFTLLGLNPLVIRVNDFTKIFGHATTLTDIRQGQHVKVLGYVAGENKVAAAQVKVEKKAMEKVKLQGPVTLINGPIISVFSVEVHTEIIPDDGFEAVEAGPVSRNDFLNLVTVGDTVSANGNLVGGLVGWQGIELLQE
ncbi:MAG: hypothetical protein JSW26_04990 [Desulfobacterales bacterium]|nr:MAG: hypothetical protein JSW26_04990 [Desulfobacterales bacterium]